MIIIAGHSLARTAEERDAAVAAFAKMVEKARNSRRLPRLCDQRRPGRSGTHQSLRMLARPAVSGRLAQGREGAESRSEGDLGEAIPQ